VTQKRLITHHRDPGSPWHAEIGGLHDDPRAGARFFDLIGEARVQESRSAFLPDGAQVVRGRASKWGIDRTETMTVWPDGRADQGVPANRPDLAALEARLREPLAIRFRPLPKEP
jgi:hypothetical protein